MRPWSCVTLAVQTDRCRDVYRCEYLRLRAEPRRGVRAAAGGTGVSDDNPLAEALFRTLIECPDYPSTPFRDFAAATAGSTSSCLLQVGDSRYCVCRKGVLSQITRDQTMAQDLVDDGIPMMGSEF